MADDTHGMGIPLPADSTPIHQYPAIARQMGEKIAEILAGGLTDELSAAAAAVSIAAVAEAITDRDLIEGTDVRLQRVLDHDRVAWAVVDRRRRAAITVLHDGTVEFPGLTRFTGSFSAGGATIQQLTDPSIAAGFTDGRRASELVIDHSGSVPKWAAERIVARGGGAAGTAQPGVVAGPGIAAWGDSITEIGGDSTSWIAQLGLGFGVPFYNGGWSSQPAKPIAARQGGAPALVTFPNNTIPRSGGAAVTLSVDPLNIPSTANTQRRGTIAGVPGVLSTASWQGPWTFTRDTAGDEVELRGAAKFTPTDGASRRNWIQIYWAGRNGAADVAGNLAATKAMIGYQSAAVPRFLVLQVLPWTNNAESAEPLNWAYSQEFPEEYVRIADWLRTDAAARAANITFTANDRADIAAGWTPRSFRSDDVHLNLAGRTAAAKRVRDEMIQRGWFTA